MYLLVIPIMLQNCSEGSAALQATFDGNWANSHHGKWESMGTDGIQWAYVAIFIDRPGNVL